ncbi:protein-L-isoaspartate(D-aspartate) O-methyltransferase-like [Ptychodera flava]|uniref:protein-L-isoaspartate(D-aspartate) O-methyltransferase-like n=1 Tax=Ptychodera flava TaxID=63121 RepID=UPI00396AAFD3
MLAVDRADFCPDNPYVDSSSPLGYPGVSINSPHTHARCLELLHGNLSKGSSALDVGSGSAYLTTCMALMVGRMGKAVGIDLVEDMVEDSITNIKKSHQDLLDSKRIKIVSGDGRIGYAPRAPYDAIHIGVSLEAVPQQNGVCFFSYWEQLKPGGRLIAFVGPSEGSQVLQQYDKQRDGTIKKTEVERLPVDG